MRLEFVGEIVDEGMACSSSSYGLDQTNGAGGWVEVKPEMLEGELEEELAKFEKFGAGINESGAEQEGCLGELEVRSVLRSDAPS